MTSSTPALQYSISPATVYITNTPGQSSIAGLTVTISNGTAGNLQLAAIGVELPTNLYQAGSLSSVNPVAGQPTLWNFEALSVPGAFVARPANGSAVTLDSGGNFTFTLNNVTLAQQMGSASILIKTEVVNNPIQIETLTISLEQASAQINALTAMPTTINPGQSATINWQCAGIDYCILSPPINGNQLAEAGSTNVAPIVDTTYSLDAFAPGLHLQQQVNVQLMRPQVAGFKSMGGNSIDYGKTILLEWETVNADSVALTTVPQLLSVPATLPVNTNGTPISIGPLTQATAFTLTPMNTSETSSVPSTLTIDINPTTATFTATPSMDVWEQDTVTLSWQITSAASITVLPPLPGGPSMLNPSGSIVLHPTAAIDYTLTVTGAPGIPSLTEIIHVDVAPVSVQLSVSPNPVIPSNNSNQTTINWNCAAQVIAVENFSNPSDLLTGSSIISAPPDGTSYKITAGTLQNPNLMSKTITISNGYGPFKFNSFSYQAYVGTTFSIINTNSLNAFVSGGYGGIPYFECEITGVVLEPNIVPGICTGVMHSSNTLTIYMNSGPNTFAWADPAVQEGTITITSVSFIPDIVL